MSIIRNATAGELCEDILDALKELHDAKCLYEIRKITRKALDYSHQMEEEHFLKHGFEPISAEDRN